MTAEAFASIGFKWLPPRNWKQMPIGKPRVRIPLQGRFAWRKERDRIARELMKANPSMKWGHACSLAAEQIGPSRVYSPPEIPPERPQEKP